MCRRRGRPSAIANTQSLDDHDAPKSEARRVGAVGTARFARAEGVGLPEREARTPKGPQGAEPTARYNAEPVTSFKVEKDLVL